MLALPTKGKPSQFFVCQKDSALNRDQLGFLYQFYPQYTQNPHELMNWLHNEGLRHEQDQINEIMRSFTVVKQSQNSQNEPSHVDEDQSKQQVEPIKRLTNQNKKPRQGKKKAAPTHSDQVSFLWQAINNGDIQSALDQICMCHAHQLMQNNHKAIHLACSAGHLQIVEGILNAGCSPNGRNDSLETPVMQAAKNNHLCICELLIEHKADLKTKSKEGYTALHFAAYFGHSKCVEVLI